MAAMWATTVEQEASFVDHLNRLRKDYPKIDEPIDEFIDRLRTYFTLPNIPVDPDSHPNIFADKLDYPPLGSEGAGCFLVTYYASPVAENPMQGPVRRYRLISISLA